MIEDLKEKEGKLRRGLTRVLRRCETKNQEWKLNHGDQTMNYAWRDPKLWKSAIQIIGLWDQGLGNPLIS